MTTHYLTYKDSKIRYTSQNKIYPRYQPHCWIQMHGCMVLACNSNHMFILHNLIALKQEFYLSINSMVRNLKNYKIIFQKNTKHFPFPGHKELMMCILNSNVCNADSSLPYFQAFPGCSTYFFLTIKLEPSKSRLISLCCTPDENVLSCGSSYKASSRQGLFLVKPIVYCLIQTFWVFT